LVVDRKGIIRNEGLAECAGISVVVWNDDVGEQAMTGFMGLYNSSRNDISYVNGALAHIQLDAKSSDPKRKAQRHAYVLTSEVNLRRREQISLSNGGKTGVSAEVTGFCTLHSRSVGEPCQCRDTLAAETYFTWGEGGTHGACKELRFSRASSLGVRGWFSSGRGIGDYHRLQGVPSLPTPVPSPDLTPVPSENPTVGTSEKPTGDSISSDEKTLDAVSISSSFISAMPVDYKEASKGKATHTALPEKIPGARPLAAIRARVPRLDFTTGLVSIVLILLVTCNLAMCIKRVIYNPTVMSGRYTEVEDKIAGRASVIDKHHRYGEDTSAHPDLGMRHDSLPASKDQFLRADVGNANVSARDLEIGGGKSSKQYDPTVNNMISSESAYVIDDAGE
jgi:hypothetical protein